MTISFREFQLQSQSTDQKPGSTDDGLVMSLLGLVGEAGTLLTEYKKKMRDGEAHSGFQSQVEEELGDIVWYVGNIATKCGLDLGEVAQKNLVKTRSRWLPPAAPAPLFDEGRQPAEQLPRTFTFSFAHRDVGGTEKVVLLDEAGTLIGDPLTDNTYDDDGYRFHDVLHLAHATVLGWSPVLRKLLRRKRKTSAALDANEDGGRAQVLEEAVAAATYEYAVRHGYLDVTRVDWDLLRLFKRITSNLEVRVRTEAEWETAILAAFRVWRQVRANNGGSVHGDLLSRTLAYLPPKK
jgi:NTP pyrophosphatase (non-canonical NTP hydrolase)